MLNSTSRSNSDHNQSTTELPLPAKSGSCNRGSCMDQIVRATINPFDDQGQAGTAYPIEIQDLNSRSFRFRHKSHLSARRAMLVLEGPQLGRLASEVDLTWCHFNQAGQYTSGGRFVQLVGKTA